MKFSKFKACLFDLDKTLTNSHKEISPRTYKALQTLTARGIKTGLCTGRHFATLYELLPNYFNDQSLHVLCGGGQIMDNKGKVFFEELISEDICREIFQAALDNHCRFLLQQDKLLYGNDLTIEYMTGKRSFSGKLHAKPLSMDKVKSWSVPLLTIAKINDQFLDRVTQLPVSVKIMNDYDGQRYVDITAKDVNKSVGIDAWCKLTGIKREEIIGFGDSQNDIEFLSHVGYGVAVGNAIQSVKEVADEVIGSCDEDGVAVFIEENFTK